MNRFIKNHFSSLITIIFLTSHFLFLNSCNSTDPPPPPPVTEPTDTVTVSITDKTHRSITLNVKTTLNNKDWKIELFREKQTEEDTLLADFSLETEDTTIIDDNGGNGLELDTEYSYYTILSTETGEVKDTSEKVIGRTLGATSHNYVWEEYTIGESGVLYDVWGTDENNVYAVGGVRINDTTYGVIHWDGSNWSPSKKIGGVYAVFGFNENDVWAVGGAVEHYDGTNWRRIDAEIIDGQAVILDPVLFNNRGYTAAWGTSSENLYFGNGRGKIVHWDGRRGSVVYDAALYVLDLWGFDPSDVYGVSGNLNTAEGKLYHFNGSSWTVIRTGSYDLNNADTYGPFTSVWGANKDELYLMADKVEVRRNNEWSTELNQTVYIEKIRGSASNNIFICGHYGRLVHYNGINWQTYNDLKENPMLGLFVTNNKTFVVGRQSLYIGTKY